MKRLSKAFLVFSSFIYTVLLFYVYAYFAEQSIIYLNLFDETISFSNNTLFYTGLIIPLLMVLIVVWLSNLIKAQQLGAKLYLKNEATKIRLSSWALSIGGVFNLFSCAILSVILFANNEEGLTQNGFLPFVMIGIILIIVWVILLPLILLKNK